MLKLHCETLSGLPDVAKQIIEIGDGTSVWCFFGEMGSGKTTLIKELCDQMGVVDVVNSPTFSIVNEYVSKEETIYHFDFYRIEDPSEASRIGVEEYLDSGNLCLMEWPENIVSLLPDQYLSIKIGHGEAVENRLIELIKINTNEKARI